MAATYKAIADAFARVVICEAYCDRWITDSDFVLIACEYDPASDAAIAFDVVMFKKALKAERSGWMRGRYRASFSEVFPGVSINHRFAQKYHFKGV
jgi:hypothetical protein